MTEGSASCMKSGVGDPCSCQLDHRSPSFGGLAARAGGGDRAWTAPPPSDLSTQKARVNRVVHPCGSAAAAASGGVQGSRYRGGEGWP